MSEALGPALPVGRGDVVWQSLGFVPLRAARALPKVAGEERPSRPSCPQQGLGSAQIWLVPEPLSSPCQVTVM